jgi:porin
VRARASTLPRLLAGVVLIVGAADGTAAQVAPEPDNAPAQAAPAERAAPVPGQTGTGTTQPPGEPGGLFERSNLLGDLSGVRTRLEGSGVSFGLTETSEVLGNATGGRARGVIYEGLTEASLGLDLGKAVGIAGGIFNVSAFQIHGRGLSTNYVNNLNVISSIEANRATRLFELWYQQAFFGGRLDVKVGQQSADLEFATSQYAGLFINASFGWPTINAVDLPAGGPSYPLAALGVRLRAQPVEPLTVLLAVFNGSPSGLGEGDPQGRRNPSGTSFRLGDGAFVIGEAQYSINAGENASGLPGTYKIGAWYNSNAFTDQFFTGAAGITAAGPFAVPPGARRGDWSVYAVADQLVWRPAGAKEGGVGVFARAVGAPGDRNVVNAFVDAGVTYKGVFGRENDTVGLGVGWARISDTARAGDAALAAAGEGFSPVRSSEVVLELSYQHQIAPWWQVQPDFQYVFSPGGVVNPDRPDRRLGDAAVFGVRTTIMF